MRLMCLAGAYAGQVQEYGAIAGLAALRVGTAARVGDLGPVKTAPPPVSPVAATTTKVPEPSKRKTR